MEYDLFLFSLVLFSFRLIFYDLWQSLILNIIGLPNLWFTSIKRYLITCVHRVVVMELLGHHTCIYLIDLYQCVLQCH